MCKKQDDAEGAQPDIDSNQTPNLASLGDALVEALVNDSTKKGNFTVGPQRISAEDQNRPLPPPTMQTYAEAVNEFTKNATAFIEQLPLLTKARTAYKEATSASREIRKILDAGDQKLRTLINQLEQGVDVQSMKPALDKKNPEPAKIESIRGIDEAGARATKWP